jgi:hypothetical protein
MADYATRYLQNSGNHYFQYAASGATDSSFSFVDGLIISNTGTVTINGASQSSYKLYVNNGTISSIAMCIDIGYTTASANFGGLDIYRSATNTVGDGSSVVFSALRSDLAKIEYAGIAGQIADATVGSVNGKLSFLLTINGTQRTERASLTSTGLAVTGSITSTVAVTSSGPVTGTTIVKSGGTSLQFLKADGSVDSSTYLTVSSGVSTYVPYTGANNNLNMGSFTITAGAFFETSDATIKTLIT